LNQISKHNRPTLKGAFNLTRNTQIIKKPKKNGLEPSVQVHYQESHQNNAFSGDCQFAHNLAKPEAAFCPTEPAFNRIAFNFILVDLLSDLSADLRISGRPSQGRPERRIPCFLQNRRLP
jgi:hypothetical protein